MNPAVPATSPPQLYRAAVASAPISKPPIRCYARTPRATAGASSPRRRAVRRQRAVRRASRNRPPRRRRGRHRVPALSRQAPIDRGIVRGASRSPSRAGRARARRRRPVGRAHRLPRAGDRVADTEPRTKGDHHRQRSRHRAHGACARHTRSPNRAARASSTSERSGNLRADVVATDLPLPQFMLSSAAELTPLDAPQLWRRSLALALDGLRTPDPHPLPKPGLNAQRTRRRDAQERQQPT